MENENGSQLCNRVEIALVGIRRPDFGPTQFEKNRVVTV